jgi:hypothetical protein
MKTNFEIVDEIESLAKKQQKQYDGVWLWGCASSLLTTQQLEIILSILKDKENN